MKYVIKPSGFEGEWIVEAFNEDDDADMGVTAFSGPWAKARAFEYVSWKTQQDREAEVGFYRNPSASSVSRHLNEERGVVTLRPE